MSLWLLFVDVITYIYLKCDVLQHVILSHKLSILNNIVSIDFNALWVGMRGLISGHLIHGTRQGCVHELKFIPFVCVCKKSAYEVVLVQI